MFAAPCGTAGVGGFDGVDVPGRAPILPSLLRGGAIVGEMVIYIYLLAMDQPPGEEKKEGRKEAYRSGRSEEFK